MQVHERACSGAITDRHISRRWSFAPSMISATPRSLLDALDGQREDWLHHGSAAINVQQLAGDEARLVSAEENHGVANRKLALAVRTWRWLCNLQMSRARYPFCLQRIYYLRFCIHDFHNMKGFVSGILER